MADLVKGNNFISETNCSANFSSAIGNHRKQKDSLSSSIITSTLVVKQESKVASWSIEGELLALFSLSLTLSLSLLS